MKEQDTTTGSAFASAMILGLFGAVGAGASEALASFGARPWFAGAASSIIVIILLWVANDALDARDRRRGV